MDGKEYTQGQKWYKGCEKICVCDDGKTGVYTCNDRYDFVTAVTKIFLIDMRNLQNLVCFQILSSIKLKSTFPDLRLFSCNMDRVS